MMLMPLGSGEIHIYLSGEDMQPLVIYRFFKTNFVIGVRGQLGIYIYI